MKYYKIMKNMLGINTLESTRFDAIVTFSFGTIFIKA